MIRTRLHTGKLGKSFNALLRVRNSLERHPEFSKESLRGLALLNHPERAQTLSKPHLFSTSLYPVSIFIVFR